MFQELRYKQLADNYKYYQEGKFDLSLKDLEELVEINPEGSGGYFNNIALCYVAMNKFSDAEKSYFKAISRDEKNISFISGLADLYLRMGNEDKAREYYERILMLEPENQYALGKLDSLKK